MRERYYSPELEESQRDCLLDRDEAHHLLRVKRGRVGDEVQLFNGAGLRADAVVVEVTKRSARLEVTKFARSPRGEGLILGSAPPKGERLLWLIEKCTELGVQSWTPLLSERTVVHPGETKIEKLRRKVIEACKQCGRDDLMGINEPSALATFLASKPDAATGWLLDPSGSAIGVGKPGWACIGPEGGWTKDEIAAAQDLRWQIHSLGGHVLRIETACLAVAALPSSGVSSS
jgi:16S rRNA (uracil1498-N3)-methyltransferase